MLLILMLLLLRCAVLVALLAAGAASAYHTVTERTNCASHNCLAEDSLALSFVNEYGCDDACEDLTFRGCHSKNSSTVALRCSVEDGIITYKEYADAKCMDLSKTISGKFACNTCYVFIKDGETTASTMFTCESHMSGGLQFFIALLIIGIIGGAAFAIYRFYFKKNRFVESSAASNQLL